MCKWRKQVSLFILLHLRGYLTVFKMRSDKCRKKNTCYPVQCFKGSVEEADDFVYVSFCMVIKFQHLIISPKSFSCDSKVIVRTGPIVCRLVYICINFCYTLGNHDYFLRNTYLSGKNVVVFFLCGPGVIFSTKCTKTWTLQEKIDFNY